MFFGVLRHFVVFETHWLFNTTIVSDKLTSTSRWCQTLFYIYGMLLGVLQYWESRVTWRCK